MGPHRNFTASCYKSGIPSALGRRVRERGAGASDGDAAAGGRAEGEEGILELGGRQPLSHLRVIPVQTGEKALDIRNTGCSISLNTTFC